MTDGIQDEKTKFTENKFALSVALPLLWIGGFSIGKSGSYLRKEDKSTVEINKIL